MTDLYKGQYAWKADNDQANLEKHGLSFQSAALAMEHGNPVLPEITETTEEVSILPALMEKALR